MPASFMTLFPQVLNSLEALKIPIQTSAALTEMEMRSLSLCFDLHKNIHELGLNVTRRFLNLLVPTNHEHSHQALEFYQEGAEALLNWAKKNSLEHLGRFQRERLGELEFLKLFTEEHPPQDWTVEYDRRSILLDLPSLKVMDISAAVRHKIKNYGVVFAPRAGHHSNIAERVALYMRDQGLTRMAIVEQKCAEDIPLYVDGKRHYEGFDGQVTQYKEVLEHLRSLTGYPAHLIAICQPGPLLMTTLILNPDLGKTFGSAGAPMHTEGEKGFLTDFARMIGEDYIDKLMALFGHTISDDHIGAGRESFDGRLHILGFYFLGMDQHFKNLKRLLADLRQGDGDAAERQKVFYEWYNYVHHFPAGFIRDTFKKIFIRNELIKGTFSIGEKKVGIKDYPGSVPIWALGGTNDEICPPLQATGHMDLIDFVPPQHKLTLVCDGGHMGLFRSTKILETHYNRILEFILSHSDKTIR
jgi:polyhydroxyalkanoate depolymerase